MIKKKSLYEADILRIKEEALIKDTGTIDRKDFETIDHLYIHPTLIGSYTVRGTKIVLVPLPSDGKITLDFVKKHPVCVDPYEGDLSKLNTYYELIQEYDLYTTKQRLEKLNDVIEETYELINNYFNKNVKTRKRV